MNNIITGILICGCILNFFVMLAVLRTIECQYEATVQIFDRLEKLEQDQKERKREAAGAQEKMR